MTPKEPDVVLPDPSVKVGALVYDRKPIPFMVWGALPELYFDALALCGALRYRSLPTQLLSHTPTWGRNLYVLPDGKDEPLLYIHDEAATHFIHSGSSAESKVFRYWYYTEAKYYLAPLIGFTPGPEGVMAYIKKQEMALARDRAQAKHRAMVKVASKALDEFEWPEGWQDK